MTRLLTAAALAVLLASPAFAQSAGGSQPYDSQSGAGPEARPGTSGNIPTDCGPNDARPECQTAQIPGDTVQPKAPDQPGNGDNPPSKLAPPASDNDMASKPDSNSSPNR